MIDINTWNRLAFDEASHSYTIDGYKLQSVTSVISRYKQPFDGEYWATYKVLQGHGYPVKPDKQDRRIVVGGDSMPVLEAMALAGMDNVKDKLQEWRDISDTAKDEGTRLHQVAEDALNGWDTGEEQWLRDYALSLPIELVATELRMYHGHVAGTPDVITTRDRELYIEDWKTDKELSWENPWDNMLDPLGDVPDCNGVKYMMQLGAYALVIYHSTGVKARGAVIHHIDKESLSVTPHELDIAECVSLARRIFSDLL